MTVPLFRFDHVSLRVDGQHVLDDISAEIPDRGAITCLLGPSGSGKSTLLRLCNRLVVPTSGTVEFRGRSLDDVDVLAHRRRVGMVFQRSTLFPGTVRENLVEADPDGTAAEGAMLRVLERVALPAEFLDRGGARLSGGEAQRACIARALIARPEVLLMDEATSALDPDATEQLEQLAVGLAHGGIPILWVTHDHAQADRIADRRLLLDAGRLVDGAGGVDVVR